MENLKNNKILAFNVFDKIQAYFLSHNYIKFKGFPMLGIYHSSARNSCLINEIREYEQKYEKEQSFIISIYNDNPNTESNNFSNLINIYKYMFILFV